jgi:hypothetical protein
MAKDDPPQRRERGGGFVLESLVDPAGGQADLVVSLEFADGSVRTFGLG